MTTDNRDNEKTECAAKMQILEQLDSWLDERCNLIVLQSTQENKWGKSDDFIEGVKASLLELDHFLWYLKAPLLKELGRLERPKDNVVPFIRRDAPYKNLED